MKSYKFLDSQGTFELENPENISYLYFPIANEAGVMSSITPTLNGDIKMGQHNFALEPVSSENLHNNKSSRNFWIRINDKDAWSATGVSSKQQSKIFTNEKEETKLTAGFMWQNVCRYSKEYNLSSSITSFVTYTKEKVELMQVVITKTGNEDIKITPIAAIPIYGRSADNIRDHRNVTSMLHRIETTRNGVIVNPTMTFNERGHLINKNLYGVFGGSENGKPVGFYPIVEDFIGDGGSFENPRAVISGDVQMVGPQYKDGGYEALGGIQFEDTILKPKESATYFVAIGFGDSKETLEADALKFFSAEEFNNALNQTKKYWENKVNISYNCADDKFDTWMQWVNFQPTLRRIYGCSFLPHHDYGKGGRGWRDLWQDCLALLIMNPKVVRSMLIDNFAGVRIDGTNATIIGSKQGEFIADRNNITRVWMDHGAWPFITTNLYIMQTGDIDLLLEKNNYFKDSQIVRGEEKDDLWNNSQTTIQKTKSGEDYLGTILEHILVQHLTAFYDVGEHNHMRLRGADWNDALDMAKERGESVAFTALYAANLEDISNVILKLKEKKNISEISIAEELLILLTAPVEMYDDITAKQELLHNYCDRCRHTITGKSIKISCDTIAQDLKTKSNWIKNHIRKTEWLTNKEGFSWYNSYYDNHGRKVEGDFEQGVRMMLTGQVFTIASGIAKTKQIESIVKAADQYLFDKSIGGYKLNTNFNEIKQDLGRMFGFAYGQKENGSVFSHMAVMYANSLYKKGFAKEGYKVIRTLYESCVDFNKSKIYPAIPEYIDSKGRGLYNYLTGSASWLLLTVLTEMYGVKGQWGDLKIEPKLTLEQFDANNKASVKFVFLGKKLNVIFNNEYKKEVGEYKINSISIDGNKYLFNNGENVINKDVINSLDENKLHEINVQLT